MHLWFQVISDQQNLLFRFLWVGTFSLWEIHSCVVALTSMIPGFHPAWLLSHKKTTKVDSQNYDQIFLNWSIVSCKVTDTIKPEFILRSIWFVMVWVLNDSPPTKKNSCVESLFLSWWTWWEHYKIGSITEKQISESLSLKAVFFPWSWFLFSPLPSSSLLFSPFSPLPQLSALQQSEK